MLISDDKVKKRLGFFTTTRLIQEWKGAEPNEVLSRDCIWDHFKKSPIILQTNRKSYNTKFEI